MALTQKINSGRQTTGTGTNQPGNANVSESSTNTKGILRTVFGLRIGRKAPRIGSAIFAALLIGAASSAATIKGQEIFNPDLYSEASEAGIIPGQQFIGQTGKAGSIRATAAFFNVKNSKLTIRQIGDIQGVEDSSTSYSLRISVRNPDNTIGEIVVPLEIESTTNNNQIIAFPDLSGIGNATILGMILQTKFRELNDGQTTKSNGAAIQVVIVGVAKTQNEQPAPTTTLAIGK